MPADDLCTLPLYRLVAFLHAGEVSPVEVMSDHLARIDALNPH